MGFADRRGGQQATGGDVVDSKSGEGGGVECQQERERGRGRA